MSTFYLVRHAHADWTPIYIMRRLAAKNRFSFSELLQPFDHPDARSES
ncbi:MAG: hypothetical protein HXS54_14160 [Theionarchaea archaeon]|nr:hypothetical protein [Theionarchaea archaeon]